MPEWSKYWIFYLNPGSHAYSALMSNEFSALELQCQPPQMVPFGPGYTDLDMANQGCTVLGAGPSGMIDGEVYAHAQYGYSTGNIWRGFGVLCAFWVFFVRPPRAETHSPPRPFPRLTPITGVHHLTRV